MATPTYHTGDHVRSLVHRHGVLPISPGDVGTVTGSGIRNYIETLCPGAHAGGRRRRAHQLRPRRNRRGALTRRRFPTDARPGRLPAAVRAPAGRGVFTVATGPPGGDPNPQLLTMTRRQRVPSMAGEAPPVPNSRPRGHGGQGHSRPNQRSPLALRAGSQGPHIRLKPARTLRG